VLGLGSNDSTGGAAAANSTFKVEWRFGNMPRKQLTFVEWSAECLQGATREGSNSWRQAYADRQTKAAADKKFAEEKQAKERAEERAAELAAMEREAEDRAQAKVKKSNDEAQKKLKMAEAMNYAARVKEYQVEREKVAAKAAVLAAEQAKEEALQKLEQQQQQQQQQKKKGTNTDDENLLCVVCWTEHKTILLEPCRHLCLCEACYEQVKMREKKECPMCRGTFTRGGKVF
jgi:pyruvate/2-oxoglutarate dehydrogenase complex dihydrolipoamide acyltransferase (E2) component